MVYFIDGNYCFKEALIVNEMSTDIFNLSKIKVLFLPFVINNYDRTILNTCVLRENKTLYLHYDESK